MKFTFNHELSGVDDAVGITQQESMEAQVKFATIEQTFLEGMAEKLLNLAEGNQVPTPSLTGSALIEALYTMMDKEELAYILGRLVHDELTDGLLKGKVGARVSFLLLTLIKKQKEEKQKEEDKPNQRS
jgi:hypothetical protein